MPNEVARIFSHELRQHGKELDRTYRRGESAEAQIAAIGQANRTAIMEALSVNQLRQAAEHFDPAGAPIYAMLTTTGAMAMNSVIARLSQPGR